MDCFPESTPQWSQACLAVLKRVLAKHGAKPAEEVARPAEAGNQPGGNARSGFAPAEGAGEVAGPLGRSQLLKPVAGTGERKTLRLATSRHV